MNDNHKPNGMFELQNARKIRPDLSKQKKQIKKPTTKKDGEAKK